MLKFSAGVTQVNLIPNGSFEQVGKDPISIEEFDLVSSWYSLTQASPDLFSRLSSDNYLQLPQEGIEATIDAYEGENVAGFITYSNQTLYREYIGVKLEERLKIGFKYRLDFQVLTGQFVGLDRHHFICNGLQVIFSVDSLFQSGNCVLELDETLSGDTLINTHRSYRFARCFCRCKRKTNTVFCRYYCMYG